jgi:hypothetical protein
LSELITFRVLCPRGSPIPENFLLYIQALTEPYKLAYLTKVLRAMLRGQKSSGTTGISKSKPPLYGNSPFSGPKFPIDLKIFLLFSASIELSFKPLTSAFGLIAAENFVTQWKGQKFPRGLKSNPEKTRFFKVWRFSFRHGFLGCIILQTVPKSVQPLRL